MTGSGGHDVATYSVWMLMPLPVDRRPWSRIAGGLTVDEADVYARTLLFELRVMPDERSPDGARAGRPAVDESPTGSEVQINALRPQNGLRECRH